MVFGWDGDEVLKNKKLPPLTDDSILVVWEFELVETLTPK
jgi:hypothetical protein